MAGFYGGYLGNEGAMTAGNTGGVPGQPLDPHFKGRLQQPGTPPPPGFREQYGLPPASGSVPQVFGLPQPGSMVAGNPSFDINRAAGPLGQRPGEQLKRLYEGGTQQNQQLNDELRRRGIMPGSGPQLPLAQSFPGPVPMGNAAGIANAEFYRGPQYGQAQMPVGFAGKTVS
jgi:hypothetical protein